MTNVEFGKGSHANWILIPRARLLAPRCNSGRGWGGEGGRGGGEGDDKGGNEVGEGQARRGTMLMAGSFVATMRLLADIFYREGGNVCASSSVKSCRGSWTIVYTISSLLSYSLDSKAS